MLAIFTIRKTKEMTVNALKQSVGISWNNLKKLDYNTKLDIIAMLTKSLRQKERKKVSAKKFYGIWQDDVMSAEELTQEIKSERRFNRDIVGL